MRWQVTRSSLIPSIAFVRLLGRLALFPGLVLIPCLPSAADESAGRILVETDSRYYRIYVSEEDGGLRHISFGKPDEIQSTVRLGHPEELIYPYARTVLTALAFLEEIPEDMACLGLGGGSLPMFFRHFHPDMRIDVVEIDPKVAQLAEDYLEYKPGPKMNTITMDGRVFLRRTDRAYDLIILDAYNTHTIPFHLTTLEFLETVRERLKPGGVAVAHIWAKEKNPYIDSQAATYLAVFDHLYLFRAPQSGSYLFVARNDGQIKSPHALLDRAREIDASSGYPFELTPLVKHQRAPITPGMRDAPVLTDDHAPVNLLRSQ